MGAVQGPGAGVVRILGLLGQQLAGEGAGRLLLAAAGGAVEQVRVRGRVLERGAEHGAGVGMGVEDEHDL